MNSLIPMTDVTMDYNILVQSDRVHTSLYKDEKIFDEEMEKIFYSTWVWVAHASELPEAGSFKTINIGK
ncbi:MAG: aromatic ring-hydroxylating dioxygenase subunit alpha, partial [Acinetobacter guillouiae]